MMHALVCRASSRPPRRKNCFNSWPRTTPCERTSSPSWASSSDRRRRGKTRTTITCGRVSVCVVGPLCLWFRAVCWVSIWMLMCLVLYESDRVCLHFRVGIRARLYMRHIVDVSASTFCLCSRFLSFHAFVCLACSYFRVVVLCPCVYAAHARVGVSNKLNPVPDLASRSSFAGRKQL